MLLEQVYLLFIELAMVTVVTIALFVALVVTMGKQLYFRENCVIICIANIRNHAK